MQPPRATLAAAGRLLVALCVLLSLAVAPGAGAAPTAAPGGTPTPAPHAGASPHASPTSPPAATGTPAPNAAGPAATPKTGASPKKGASPQTSFPPPLQAGLGVASWYPLLTYPLTDRMQLQVNLANGNLLAEATDLAIKGTGHDLVVGRVWQSVALPYGGTAAAFSNWTTTAGADVELDNQGGTVEDFYDASGAQYRFTGFGGSYTSPPGIDATLVGNQDGSFTLTYHATGERLTFLTAQGGQQIPSVTADTDQNGNAITYAYDPANGSRLTAITDTQGRQVSVSYGGGPATAISRMADWTGRAWQYGYDPTTHFLATYTDPNNKQTSYGYANGLLTQITDPNTNVTAIGYDQLRRVTSITFGQGSAVAGTYTFAYNNGTTVVTDPNSHASTYAYDNQQRLTGITDALSNSVQFGWTSDNHVQQVTDAKGQVFAYGYNANNSLTAIQLPTGATTSWAYADGAHPYYPTSTPDPQGNTTTIHYTAAGNPDVVTNQLPSQNQTRSIANASRQAVTMTGTDSGQGECTGPS